MIYIFLIFKLIIELSIISIIPIIVVIIINKILKNRMAYKFQYMLYLLILIRLLVPMLPKTSTSVFNAFEIDKRKAVVIDVIANNNIEKQFGNKNLDFSKLNKDMSIYTTNIKLFNLEITNLFLLWLSGVICLSIYNLLVFIKFRKKITLSASLKDKNIDFLIKSIKATLNITKDFRVVEMDSINSPAIFVSKAPIILLPKGLSKELTCEDLKNILFHELCHYKRKDILPIYLSKIISIIYWFNPLVLYALKECKKTLELSCDEMVLYYIGQEEKLNYGYTIINLINHTKNSTNPSMAISMIGTKKQITSRMKFIRDFKKKGRLSKILSIIVLFLMTSILFTESNVVASQYMNDGISCSYEIDKEGRLKKVDNINLPYKYDCEVLGTWESVDFINNINDFNPNKKNWPSNLSLKNLKFLSFGETSFKELKWTKGYLIHHSDETASKYSIKSIDGYDYMFLEWKSGDYSFRNMKPKYYVLKKQ